MDSKEAAELYKAADDMKDWFVSYWQKIVQFLELVQSVNDAGLDEAKFIHDMEAAVLELKVVDPIPRLTALDKQISKWRSMTMGDAAKASWVGPSKDPVPSLMKEMVGVNAIAVLRLYAALKDHSGELMAKETQELMKRLHDMTLQAAPWLCHSAELISKKLEEEDGKSRDQS